MAGAVLLLGVDIGGTFTDLMLFDPGTGSMGFMKVLTTPDDLSRGVLEGIRAITEAGETSAEEISSAIHGSTIGINTIIERKGARTGLITTGGFEDVLLIGRQTRPRIYDWTVGRPRPLVPGSLRKGVRERTSYTGEILEPLDLEGVRDSLRHLKEDGAESIAICLLHSYANPIHENEIERAIGSMWPDAYVSVSSALLPEFREYERMSTTVANAYIGPIVSKYIEDLENSLEDVGVRQLLVMQANGGLMTTGDAMTRAVNTLESGPAGGVIAAAYIGGLVGRKQIISFDMGGTTAKSSIIIDGKPLVTTEYEISPLEHGERIVKGSGHPIKTPVVDLIEVGAGGGSIAWIDSGGALRVGPISAGADPGPACYGMGGKEPTITDANVVLGRINPDFFLGGEMSLDAEASRKTVARIAGELGVDIVEAAEGIVRVTNSTMARSIRYVTTERGHDAREFSIVAFGGAAPVQVVDLAEAVGIGEVIIPPSPGVFSAFGFLVADIVHHYVKTVYIKAPKADPEWVEAIFTEMEETGSIQLDEDEAPREDWRLDRSVDMRYVGQSHELNVPVPSEIREDDLEEIVRRFHAIHMKHYGYNMPDEAVALVSFRLVARGIRSKPAIEVKPMRVGDLSEALKGSRSVHFADEGWIECDVYDRELLSSGSLFRGPCVVEEWDTTTIVNSGYRAEVDAWGNLLLTRGGGA
jgi:N-methylhydantoinase A